MASRRYVADGGGLKGDAVERGFETADAGIISVATVFLGGHGKFDKYGIGQADCVGCDDRHAARDVTDDNAVLDDRVWYCHGVPHGDDGFGGGHAMAAN